jgi:oligoribonuclease NrnB/cAMP/cGMP phosphodiesterase (DHH superfamily)
MLCLYHKNCTDGLGAALAVHEWLKEQGRLGDCEFQPVQYGDTPPDVAEQDVIIVDFSFPRDILLEMEKKSSSLIVIDHHKTAQAELGDLDFAIFDMDKAGCILTWEYLFPDTPPPLLFEYLQDRDLWRWELPQSRELSAALRSHKPDFDVWENFLSPKAVKDLKGEGVAILRYQQSHVDMVLADKPATAEIGGHNVPCINTTTLISEIGNELARGQPFAAMYFDLPDKRVFSLRSDENGVDVAEIAKQYGGGGHKHAAGFTVQKPPVIGSHR